jgi:hypothetical protein
MSKKRKILPATVEKVIKPNHPGQPEKAQIHIEGADDLYREIRVENTMTDAAGRKGALKEGQAVDVILEAGSDPGTTNPARRNDN